MCGILAVADLKQRPLSRERIRRLRDTMIHRGPDDEGLFLDGPVALAHRRLSIIDLTRHGQQPMTNEDGTLQVAFNGEIYNYVELARDLRARGHVFHSSTDTEVILHQYEEDGERCVEKLRGMFGFVIWDSRRQRLFAARDRFGIKPLYYYHDGSRFLLASEMKAIVEDDEVPSRPNMHALADYLFAGRALGRKTVFEGIHELEPGWSLTLDMRTGRLDVQQYWDLRYDYNYSRSEEATHDELFSILDDAVAVQCRSDAALGAHLSGGVDSSSVVAFAARHREHLKTFSIMFPDGEHVDDARYARAVARHVGADYHETTPTSDDLASMLPLLLWHMDAPMISDGGFGYFTASRFAREHVKVTLTGHGGDEVFAGYPAQFETTFGTNPMMRRIKDPERVAKKGGLLERAIRKGPRGLVDAVRRRAAGGSRSLEEQWIARHCHAALPLNPSIDPAWLAQLGEYSPVDEYIAPFTNAGTDQVLDKCLYHDIRVYLPSLLHKEDRVSMAVSIESRVPLLDDRLVEFLATVPPELKVKGMQPKHLLRRASSRLLPENISQNPIKRGFPVPARLWKAPGVNDMVRRVLLSKESLDRGIFTKDALRRVCDGAGDPTQFFAMINIELWFKLFIDRDRQWTEKVKESRGALVAC